MATNGGAVARRRARRLGSRAATLLLLSAGVRCASIVGIKDVPPGDGGVAAAGDGAHGGPGDAGVQPSDAAARPDRTTPASDASAPGVDAPGPTTDAGSPDGAIPYAASNLGRVAFDPSITGPLVIHGSQNCVIDTSYPDPLAVGCTGGDPQPGDFFSVNLAGGAGQATIYVFTSVLIEAGGSLTVQGPNPLILVVLGSVDIRGSIDASADRADPNATAMLGGHATGAGVGGFSSGGPAGGGGGSYCGTGGHGAGTSGAASAPGATYGSASLVPLLGGSAGGGANTNGAAGDFNGNGGGALQISATGTITVEPGAFITASGSGAASSSTPSGEGGGSGGAILLEAPTVTVAGLLEANGGQGSDPQYSGANPPDDGGVASNAGCAGGSGSAGAALGGGDGQTTANGYGGGGGGAGRIRINAAHVSVTGTLSPPLGSGCATQATLP